MWQLKNDEVEALLKREVRARLSLARQLLLYLNPFALFKDASSGPASVRQRALHYNRSIRWMLPAYIRRWTLLAVPFFLGVTPAQAFAAATSLHIVPMALGLGCCLAVTVLGCTVVVYVFLGLRE